MQYCSIYVPCVYVLNKIDAITIEELDLLYKLPHVVPISAEHNWNLDELLERIWEYLHLVRMFVCVVALSIHLSIYLYMCVCVCVVCTVTPSPRGRFLTTLRLSF